MSWVKLDDRFTDNPKVAGLSDRAFRVHVMALCYVAGSLTDGKIPDSVALRWPLKARDELVNAGLWHPIMYGYEINDYLEYNPARSKVVETRQAKAAAGAKGGAATAARAKAKHSAGRLVRPPSRPVPTPKAGPTDRNPDQPTDDQLYIAEKLGDLTPAAIVKLNQKHGRAKVESAMREMHGFPTEERVRSVYAYVDAIAGGFDD